MSSCWVSDQRSIWSKWCQVLGGWGLRLPDALIDSQGATTEPTWLSTSSCRSKFNSVFLHYYCTCFPLSPPPFDCMSPDGEKIGKKLSDPFIEFSTKTSQNHPTLPQFSWISIMCSLCPFMGHKHWSKIRKLPWFFQIFTKDRGKQTVWKINIICWWALL